MKDEFVVVGLMSGTSLDGLDLAACTFNVKGELWSYDLKFATTIPYSSDWRARLANAHLLSEDELKQLDKEYGKFLSYQLQSCCSKRKIRPALIASHGHTVFHAPERGYTLQIGSGNEIAIKTGLPVVYDFRSPDIAKGGQGAPLVPVGDKLLFGEYDACLNLGGFSNISFDTNGQRIAFDICPVNIILNQLALIKNMDFDDKGKLGRAGNCDKDLLSQLNALSYYQQHPPKSLSREWLEIHFLPLITKSKLKTEDIAATVYFHIANQIGRTIKKYKLTKILVSGGGALNNFLIEMIKKENSGDIVIPERLLIDFKEAIIFAFLGLLRYQGLINCYASVTGAREDSSTGVLIK